MAAITAPDFRIANIEWALDRPAQANIGLSGVRRLDETPLYGKWFASVDLAPIQGESNYRLIRSFLMRCYGSLNTFKLYAVSQVQNSNSGVTVAANASAGDTSFTITGATTSLTDGQLVTVNGQLLQLTADQSGSTLAFEPPLREDATAGTSVETARPWATVRLASPDVSWTIDVGQVFTSSFAVEEAF